jgi:apolipoprotein N-acyltransferase
VALVPWLAALDRLRSPRATLAAALLMAVAVELAMFGWFADAIEAYTATPRLLGLALLVVCAPVLQPQIVAFAMGRWLARRRGAGAARLAVTGACVWIGTEWLCPKLFDDTLGYALWPAAWLRQAADVAGVSGLTFALLLGNECVLAAMRAIGGGRARRALWPAVALGALLLALAGYGAWRERQVATAMRREDPVRVGVVQADISRYGRMAAEQGTGGAVETILDAYVLLSRKLLRRGPLDLLVWPETVYPTTFGSPKSAGGAAYDRAIAGFVARTGVPLVFGAYDADGGGEFNAAVFLEPPHGGPLEFETYRKASLFPLTERVPAWFDRPRMRRWLPWLGTWVPGRGGETVTLALPGGRRLPTAPLICYDALAPGLVRAAVRAGAEVIVTLSNDAWFGDGPAAWLHLVGAAFRSVETRRPQVRSTNTGISAVIDAGGSIVVQAGVGTRAVMAAAVTPEARATTPVLRWGCWLGPLAVVLAITLLIAPRWPERRRRKQTSLKRPRRRCTTSLG